MAAASGAIWGDLVGYSFVESGDVSIRRLWNAVYIRWHGDAMQTCALVMFMALRIERSNLSGRQEAFGLVRQVDPWVVLVYEVYDVVIIA